MTSAVRWRFFLNFLSCTRKVILTCWRYHDGEMARHMAVIRLQCHVLSGRGCRWGNHRRCLVHPAPTSSLPEASAALASSEQAPASVATAGAPAPASPPEAAAASAAPASAAAVVTPPAAPRPADSRCANHHHEPAVRPGHLCFEEESVPPALQRPPRPRPSAPRNEPSPSAQNRLRDGPPKTGPSARGAAGACCKTAVSRRWRGQRGRACSADARATAGRE